MDLDLLSPEAAEQLFNECDVRRKGALTIDDFRSLSQFSDAETAFIFEQLDVNKDGLVTKEEFVTGFARALNLGERKGFSDIKRRGSYVALPPVFKNASVPASPLSVSVEEVETGVPKINYDLDADSARVDLPW